MRTQSGFTVESSGASIPVEASLTSPADREQITTPNVTLEWTSQDVNASFFKLSLANVSERILDNHVIAASANGTNSFIVTDLAPDNYAWSITSCSDAGCSAEVGRVFILEEPATELPDVPEVLRPASPNNLTPSGNINEISPQLRWSEVEDADYYQLNLSSANEVIYDDREVNGNNFSTPDLNDGLYSWSVSACNDAGCSEPTSETFSVEDLLGTMTINIIDAATNRAISNFNIVISESDTGVVVVDTAILDQTTDLKLPVGHYQVVVTKSGYLDHEDQFCQSALSGRETLCQFEVTEDPNRVNYSTSLISSDEGGSANGGSFGAVVSDNGGIVIYQSDASNIVDGDTNNATDVFIFNSETNQTRRVELPGIAGGIGSYALSGNGRTFAFCSSADNLTANDTNNSRDVFLYELETEQLERITLNGMEGNGDTCTPSVSTDGRFISFLSSATNFVANDTNERTDTFVYDRVLGSIERVSLSNAGLEANSSSRTQAISGDGRYVAFSSFATNLIDGITNTEENLYLYELETNELELISVGISSAVSNGRSRQPHLSNNGRYISYVSGASNLAANDNNNLNDIFRYDRVTKTNLIVSTSSFGVQGDRSSESPSISADGRYVNFITDSGNIDELGTGGDRHLFLKDVFRGETFRISLNSTGGRANDNAFDANVSGDGTVVAFHSGASDLVENDTNGVSDVFVATR